MSEYRYTTEDRRIQLGALVAGLKELIPVVSQLPEFASRVSEYQTALEKAQRFLTGGFTQDELSELSRAIPDLYFRHKEWMPPIERLPSGEWKEPEWFTHLETKLQPVLQTAETLRVLGHY